MRNLFNVSVITIILGFMVSCNNDDSATTPVTIDPNITFKATLNGTSEVPTNTSTATGSATLVYNSTTKVFTVNVTHTVTSPSNGHIHKGAVGVNGSPVFPFSTFTSPINYTSGVLDATQEADLYQNLYYVNIHSTTFTGGEIRGQLIKQTSTTPGGY
jgi:hypothetical protein